VYATNEGASADARGGGKGRSGDSKGRGARAGPQKPSHASGHRSPSPYRSFDAIQRDARGALGTAGTTGSRPATSRSAGANDQTAGGLPDPRVLLSRAQSRDSRPWTQQQYVGAGGMAGNNPSGALEALLVNDNLTEAQKARRDALAVKELAKNLRGRKLTTDERGNPVPVEAPNPRHLPPSMATVGVVVSEPVVLEAGGLGGSSSSRTGQVLKTANQAATAAASSAKQQQQQGAAGSRFGRVSVPALHATAAAGSAGGSVTDAGNASNSKEDERSRRQAAASNKNYFKELSGVPASIIDALGENDLQPGISIVQGGRSLSGPSLDGDSSLLRATQGTAGDRRQDAASTRTASNGRAGGTSPRAATTQQAPKSSNNNNKNNNNGGGSTGRGSILDNFPDVVSSEVADAIRSPITNSSTGGRRDGVSGERHPSPPTFDPTRTYDYYNKTSVSSPRKPPSPDASSSVQGRKADPKRGIPTTSLDPRISGSGTRLGTNTDRDLGAYLRNDPTAVAATSENNPPPFVTGPSGSWSRPSGPGAPSPTGLNGGGSGFVQQASTSGMALPPQFTSSPAPSPLAAIKRPRDRAGPAASHGPAVHLPPAPYPAATYNDGSSPARNTTRTANPRGSTTSSSDWGATAARKQGGSIKIMPLGSG
jgi:hypothetical protein